MKRIKLIFAALIICLSAQAQTLESDADTLYGYEQSYASRMAGGSLMNAYRIQQTGNITMITGLAIGVTGIASSFVATDNPEVGLYIAAGGAGLSLLGWLFNLSANKHIGNAGRYLQGVIPINHGKRPVVLRAF